MKFTNPNALQVNEVMFRKKYLKKKYWFLHSFPVFSHMLLRLMTRDYSTAVRSAVLIVEELSSILPLHLPNAHEVVILQPSLLGDLQNQENQCLLSDNNGVFSSW